MLAPQGFGPFLLFMYNVGVQVHPHTHDNIEKRHKKKRGRAVWRSPSFCVSYSVYSSQPAGYVSGLYVLPLISDLYSVPL